MFSLLPSGTHARSAGQIRGDGSFAVFSQWQGAVGYSVWLELSSSWGRPKSTLATRTQFCPHAHTPTTGSRLKAARWLGYRVQSETERKFVPSANVVLMSYSGSQGLCSRAQQITQTRLEGTWPQTYTQAHKTTPPPPLPLSLSISIYSKLCILALYNGWKGIP